MTGLFVEESEAIHYSVPSYLAARSMANIWRITRRLASCVFGTLGFKVPSRPCSVGDVGQIQRKTQLSCNFKSEQVTQRNKLQQKHLPMPTLVNCSPARDWVISIHFKFHRLRDVRSFVDKCLTATPGTPLKVFSWIIPVYIRKCLLVSLHELTYSVISFHRGVCSKSGGFLGSCSIGNWKSFCVFFVKN